MKRLHRDAVLLSLMDEMLTRGSWCGETHIQKASYFLQELLRVPLGFEFILYKHGPYSFDLSDELTAMRADSMLRYQPRPYPYGPSLVPIEKELQSSKQSFPKTLGKYESQIEFIASKLGDKTVSELERLATALYVTFKEKGNLGGRAERIHELKPHISMEDARLAVQDVDRIIEEARQTGLILA